MFYDIQTSSNTIKQSVQTEKHLVTKYVRTGHL